jgi:UDP-glucose 4-epimerase
MTGILVTGGAGYIGSHMTKILVGRGYKVTVLDNLSTGHRDAVSGARLIEADLGDTNALEALFRETAFSVVMHFAGSIEAGESVINPGKYYRNNVCNTLRLLDAMRASSCNKLVFSSSAAVYGEPRTTPIPEDHPTQPVNPYGKTKWIAEQMLADYDSAHGMRSVSLRYFNAAGADPDGTLGERHEPESHLIPLVLQTASGRRESISIYGDDYSTPDGTCVRDYIHVKDLCDAHLLAMEYLLQGGCSRDFNLGNGTGYSVREIIDTARRVTGKTIAVERAARRPGDPATLVADASRAKKELGWNPRYTDLATIIDHAWAWECKQHD